MPYSMDGACSTSGERAVAALADNVGRSATLRAASASAVASPSIRAPVANRADGDWAAFARPQPMPFGSAPTSSFGGSPGTLAEWLDRFHADEGAASAGYIVGGSETAARWAPEVQTSLEVSRGLASSPALSASSYDCPTPDEAEHVCYTPEPTRGRKGGRDDDAAPPPAHELTLFASPTAVWNHDALFSVRRRWFGGKRVATMLLTDGDEAAFDLPASSASTSGATTTSQSGFASPAHQPTLRTRSRSRSRSRLCEEIVPSTDASEAERAALVHAQLRETAMSRLGGIMRHLGLASTTTAPAKRRPATSSSS